MTRSDPAPQTSPGPLDGIKILEYGVFHAGPGGSAILGDLGADVIKIETESGDPERYWTRVAGLDFATKSGESLMYEVSNRNKRGICLDIQTRRGREIFNRLIRGTDVFLTNLRKSTKQKLGIDYPSIAKINPKVIHANVSGYGPEGPMCDIGAFDPLGQACSGMMFLTGSQEPALIHIGVLDQATAIAASHAIITALLVKERRGIGQEIHVSLYGTALWLQHPNLMLANALSIDPCVTSTRSQHSPLRNSFCCRDGKWIIGTHHPQGKILGDIFAGPPASSTCSRTRILPMPPENRRTTVSWLTFSTGSLPRKHRRNGWKSVLPRGSCFARCTISGMLKPILRPWSTIMWCRLTIRNWER